MRSAILLFGLGIASAVGAQQRLAPPPQLPTTPVLAPAPRLSPSPRIGAPAPHDEKSHDEKSASVRVRDDHRSVVLERVHVHPCDVVVAPGVLPPVVTSTTPAQSNASPSAVPTYTVPTYQVPTYSVPKYP